MVYTACLNAFCHLIHMTGLFILPLSTCFFVLQSSSKQPVSFTRGMTAAHSKTTPRGCKWRVALGCRVVCRDTWAWGDQLLLKAKFNILKTLLRFVDKGILSLQLGCGSGGAEV